jgi:energy-coupling factor transport system substrate-specific component
VGAVRIRWQAALALVLAIGVVVAGTVQAWPWYASAIACLALLAFAFLESFELQAVNPKYLALVATVSALAAVGRAVAQGIPGVQPATFFVIMAGYAFGPLTGAAVGAFAALGSNLFLGEGAWTPWQMLAWGLAGLTAGWFRLLCPRFRLVWMVPFGFVWGYVFGWIMNTWMLLGGADISVPAYLTLCAASAAFDTNHALANAVLVAVAGPFVNREFGRFRKRLQTAELRENDLSK